MSDEQTIFAEALARPSPRDRLAYLDAACRGQAELRKRVERLLEAHDRAGEFLEAPPPTVQAAGPLLLERSGAMIGPYKLLEQIGEGGMGVVFIAEQTRPIQRRVALKIVKPGLDTKQVIARFEAERQALAMMDHPNIAKVLDAGATDAGRPYFVMELVKGIPITQYCDQHRLTPRQRLDLFVQVCHAVQHAHQKGIIHRDIKPSNVLVTLADDGRATPKVIDFGIAKAIAGQRLTDRTLYTELRQFIGTPLYMSPEQAEMSALMDADTRSDVYSLGVLLYELLTGTTPFEKERLAQAAYDEVRRIIREEEPPRPSTRLSTLGQTVSSISAQRGTDPKALRQIVSGELDWIVMRAMEKDRSRRYETAVGLAHDIERYLTDRPVEACPPSKSYRLKKFVRRNKTAISVGAAIAIVLVVATAISTIEAVRATRAERQVKLERDQAVAEKQRADEQSHIAEAVQDFLNDDLLRQSDVSMQEANANKNLTVRDALDRAAAQIGDRFKDQPLVEAAIRSTIGDTYMGLDLVAEARKHLTVSWEIRKRILGPRAPETLQTIGSLAYCYAATGEAEKAKAMLIPILEEQEKQVGQHDERLLPLLRYLTEVYLKNGEDARAEAISRRFITIASDAHETHSIQSGKHYLAVALTRMGRLNEAEPLMMEVLHARQKTWGENHLRTARIEEDLAILYRAEKKFELAMAMQERVLQTCRRVFGDDDDETVKIIYGLGWICRNANQQEKAWQYINEALERERKKHGDANAFWLNDVAYIHLQEKQYSRAEDMCQRVLRGWRQPLGDNDTQIIRAMANLGWALQMQGKNEEANRWLMQVLGVVRKQEDIPRSSFAISVVGLALKETRRFTEAEECFLRILKILQASVGPDHPDLAECYARLAQIAFQLKHYDEAEQRSRAAIAIRDKLDVPGWKGATARTTLGEVLIERGKLDEAERALSTAYAELKPGPGGVIEPDKRQAIEEAFVHLYERWQKPEKAAVWKQKTATAPSTAMATTRKSEHPSNLLELENLAGAYNRQHQYDRAEPLYIQALNQTRKTYGALNPGTAITVHELAWMYLKMHRYADAEHVSEEQIELVRKTADHSDLDLAQAFYDFGALEQSMGKPDEAANLFRQTAELRRKSLGDHEDVAMSLVSLMVVLRSQEKYAEAAVAIRDALEIRQRLLPKGDWRIANTKRVLGSVLTLEGKYAEAEEFLLAADKEFAAAPPPSDQTTRVFDAFRQTAELYEKWGKPDQAAVWRAKLPQKTTSRPTSRAASQAATQPN